MGSVSSVKDAQAWPLLAKAHSSETPFRRSWSVLADVDRLNPPLRQDFLIDMPASACLRKSMICSSVNRVVFISAILQSLRTYCHYLGTAGRGQVKMSKLKREEFLTRLPKRRLIEPIEVANIIVFLASEYSSVLNGAVIDASMGLGVRPGSLTEFNDH